MSETIDVRWFMVYVKKKWGAVYHIHGINNKSHSYPTKTIKIPRHIQVPMARRPGGPSRPGHLHRPCCTEHPAQVHTGAAPRDDAQGNFHLTSESEPIWESIWESQQILTSLNPLMVPMGKKKHGNVMYQIYPNLGSHGFPQLKFRKTQGDYDVPPFVA